MYYIKVFSITGFFNSMKKYLWLNLSQEGMPVAIMFIYVSIIYHLMPDDHNAVICKARYNLKQP